MFELYFGFIFFRTFCLLQVPCGLSAKVFEISCFCALAFFSMFLYLFLSVGRNLGYYYQTMSTATNKCARHIRIAVVNSICVTNQPACVWTAGMGIHADTPLNAASAIPPARERAPRSMEHVCQNDPSYQNHYLIKL